MSIPSQADLLAQLQTLQSQVTLLTESQADREARQVAEERDELARIASARQAAREASEPTRQRALKAAQNRAAKAAAVDAAGDALVEALHALRGDSQQIAVDAQAVIVARHEGRRMSDTAGQALPHAYAVSGPFAAALAHTIKRLIAVIGSEAMRDLIAVNDFAEITGRTFAEANSIAFGALEARL